MEIHQRIAVILSLGVGLLTPGLSPAQSSSGARPSTGSDHEISHAKDDVPGLHDFDFLVGYWQVHHRKLKERLVNSHEWIEFEGTLFSQSLMGGFANVDDDVFEVPGALIVAWLRDHSTQSPGSGRSSGWTAGNQPHHWIRP